MSHTLHPAHIALLSTQDTLPAAKRLRRRPNLSGKPEGPAIFLTGPDMLRPIFFHAGGME